MSVRIVDAHIGAHPVCNEIILDKFRQQALPLRFSHLNGQGHNELPCQPAVLGFLVFLHGIPERTTVRPFGWRIFREEYLLPDKALFSGVIVLYTVVVI